jgi:uncharacterized protein
MSSVTSVSISNRNFNLDVMRGVAVLGILLMNVAVFAGNEFLIVWNDAIQHHFTLNGFIFDSSNVVLNGKMRGLFTLLFGAGLLLFIRNKQDNNIAVADAYFRRMMWMLVFGLADAYLLLWAGDILYEYALCGMLLFAFRNMRVRYMLCISFLFLTIFTYNAGKHYSEGREKSVIYTQTNKLLKERKPLTAEQKKIREEFQETLDHSVPFPKKTIDEIKKDLQEDNLVHHLGYGDIFEKHAEDVFESQTEGFYTGFFESFSMILLGMALFKLGFFEYRLKMTIYRMFTFIGIPLGWAIMIFSIKVQAKTVEELWFTYSWRPFSALWLEMPARVLLTVSYAAAFMLLCRINFMKPFLNLLSNTGRMAFTNYIMQTVLCSFYFFGFGLGHYGEYDATGLFVFVSCIWILQITYSNTWLHYFKMGPLEWLWKRLTYGKGFNTPEIQVE